MAEKRSFWSSVPGLVTGLAAIITGLVALISVFTRFNGSHNTSNNGAPSPPAATSSPTPTATGVTTTSTPTMTDTASPSPGASPGASPGVTTSPASPGAPATLTASPSSGLDFGSVGIGQTSPVRTVTITNAGGSPAVIQSVNPDGTNSSWFSIATSTCGNGAALQPQQTCQVGIQVKPSSVGSGTATLDVTYQGDNAQPLSVPLSVTGSIL
ncbi:MAG TPA: choice-of-anchor D domain-containing protein [Actinomycetota bacterium]|nr:choice-of-anchor D domain-containing protein [Actinomycetota bacterium]